ncbi:MAG: prolipoprotein diacylglyceryl transferase family protein [Fimbriimonadaceae bacterium]
MNTALGVGFNVLAFTVGALVYFWEARRRNMNLSKMREVAMLGALIGVVAASVGQWGYAVFSGSHSVGGGRTIVAGVLGGWLGVEIAKRRLGIRESTGPLWALALPAGEAIGRIGCWFHGCCYGKVCSLPWAINGRHPTQFYLSIAAMASFGLIWWLKDRVDVFALSLLLWSIGRIIIEPLRESSTPTPWLVPSICVVVATYATIRLVRSKQVV